MSPADSGLRNGDEDGASGLAPAGQRKGEHGAPTWPVLDRNVAPVQPGILPCNRQAEAASGAAGPRGIRLVEAVEDEPEVLGGDAGARIRDPEAEVVTVGGQVELDRGQPVLERVVHQVAHDCVEAAGVGAGVEVSATVEPNPALPPPGGQGVPDRLAEIA